MWNDIFLLIKNYQTILALLLTLFLYYKIQLRYARLLNLSSIVNIERSLGEMMTNGFRFHGITEQDIANAGLKKEELAYLVANFTAGRIYDVSSYTMWWGTFKEDNYRYKMLAQEDTRKAWHLIVRMMTADSYIHKLERTKDKIENSLNHTT